LTGESARRCAQRLSASKRLAGWITALRSFTRASAQRLSASKRLAALALAQCCLSSWCSTPFGIEEVGGHGNRPDRGFAGVLNAFRHRRGWRTHPSAGHAARRECSTPFGIEEVGGDRLARVPEAIPECSTPFGIEEVGGRDRGGPIRGSAVLNAFRHRRGWRGCTARGRQGPAGSAQRLSASKRLAAPND